MKSWNAPRLPGRLVAYYAALMFGEILIPHVPHALYGVLAILPLVVWRCRSAAR